MFLCRFVDQNIAVRELNRQQTKTVMVSKFERVLYSPLEYQTYSSQNDKTGEVEEFIFKDIVKENYEEAAEFMLEYYAKDETFLNAIKISQTVLKEFYLFVFAQNSAVGCFKKGTNELVGVNALSVKTQGVDTSFKVKFVCGY